ncbi:Hypothetical predicted protein, partial [Paramuricea clavata]
QCVCLKTINARLYKSTDTGGDLADVVCQKSIMKGVRKASLGVAFEVACMAGDALINYCINRPLVYTLELWTVRVRGRSSKFIRKYQGNTVLRSITSQLLHSQDFSLPSERHFQLASDMNDMKLQKEIMQESDNLELEIQQTIDSAQKMPQFYLSPSSQTPIPPALRVPVFDVRVAVSTHGRLKFAEQLP